MIINNRVLQLVSVVVLTFFSYALTKSLLVVLVIALIVLLSMNIGFQVGGRFTTMNIVGVLEEKGYYIYIDEETDELKITRKYGDHWYKDK